MRPSLRIAFATAIATIGCLSVAAADAPSMPAAHPNFQAMHVSFGRFACEFRIRDKVFHVAGVTELSPDGRRAVSRDPQGAYFSNLFYDSQRTLWINTSIYTFIGLDFTGTSPGWSGGQVVFNGLISMQGRSLPFRATSTELSSGKTKTIEELQDLNGDWSVLDTKLCGKG